MAKFRVAVEGKNYRVEAPDEATAWDWANQTHDEYKVKHDTAVKAEEDRVRENFKKEEAARPYAERAFTNFQAGVHKLGRHIVDIPRDVFGLDVGATKEEREEQKRIDKGLAEGTAGGEYWQTAGETLPTMLVPAGGAGMLGAKMLPKAAQFAAKVSPRVANVASVAGTQGLLGAATSEGDLGDRLMSGGIAAGAGAALPAAMAGIRGGYRMVAPAGRNTRAAERLLQEVGPQAANDIAEAAVDPVARARFRMGGVEKPTVAQVTANPAMQEIETGLRATQAPSFAAGDAAAAQGRADVIKGIAGNADDLAAAEAARKAATDPMRDAALAAADAPRRAGIAAGVPARPQYESDVMQKALQIGYGPSRPNPGVQKMVNYVMGELEQGVSAEQLYTVRKTLTHGIPHGTELGAAISQSRAERVALVKAIDDALDKQTGGAWTPYLKKYQQMSDPVTSLKAGQSIEKAFESGANKTATGDPVYTASKLRQTLAKYGTKQFGSKTFDRLTPEQQDTVRAVADSIEAADKARKSQGLIGSATAGNRGAAERAAEFATNAIASAIPMGSMIAPVLTKSSSAWQQRALAELMQDPEKFAQFLKAAQQASGWQQGANIAGAGAGQGAARILKE